MKRALIMFILVLLGLSPAVLAQVTFTDVRGNANIDNDILSEGVSWCDSNQDGYPDIFLSGSYVALPWPLPDIGNPNRMYINRGPGGGFAFDDRAESLGLVDPDASSLTYGSAWGDFNNDGRPDLYIVRGIQELISESHKIYRNDGSRFNDAPSQYIVSAGAGRSAAWVDYNSDGCLDVYVTNGIDSPTLLPDAHPYLFKNNCDGTFTDVTSLVGLVDTRNGFGAAWADYDNDGDQDLYVVNHGFEDSVLGIHDPQPCRLYKNKLAETGVATFEDVAPAAGVDGASGGYGAAWGDYNNDGWLDLYVTNGFSSILQDAPNKLYSNNKNGTFTDVALLNGTAGLDPSTGCTWLDYDNDGNLDIFVSNIQPILGTQATNRLYKNTGFLLFTDASTQAGVGDAVSSNSCAVADFDRDGDLDLYVTITGIFNAQDKLYKNNAVTQNSNHWLEFKLIGTVSNRMAIGARVKVTRLTSQKSREVSGGSGYESQNDTIVHFGLGSITNVDAEIRWPSGCVQQVNNINANQLVEVIESCGVMRGEYRQPLSTVFPLPPYDSLPAVAPYIDPQPVLKDGKCYFYQIQSMVKFRMWKTSQSIAIYY